MKVFKVLHSGRLQPCPKILDLCGRNDKRSSLLRYGNNYGHKRYIVQVPKGARRTQWKAAFSGRPGIQPNSTQYNDTQHKSAQI